MNIYLILTERNVINPTHFYFEKQQNKCCFFIWISLFHWFSLILKYFMFSSPQISFSNRGNIWNLVYAIKLFCPSNSFVSASWCLMLPIFHHLTSKKELVAYKTRSRNSQHIRKSFITLFNHVCFSQVTTLDIKDTTLECYERKFFVYNKSYISQLS